MPPCWGKITSMRIFRQGKKERFGHLKLVVEGFCCPFAKKNEPNVLAAGQMNSLAALGMAPPIYGPPEGPNNFLGPFEFCVAHHITCLPPLFGWSPGHSRPPKRLIRGGV